MGIDYGKQIVADLDLDSINSIEDFCKKWPKIKPILATAQSILSVLFPPAAAVIGVIITVLDNVCHGKKPASNPGASPT